MVHLKGNVRRMILSRIVLPVQACVRVLAELIWRCSRRQKTKDGLCVELGGGTRDGSGDHGELGTAC